MSLLTRFLGLERRAATVRLSDPYIGQFLGHRPGGAVDPRRAAGHPAATACISAIAQNLAAVPLSVYRRAEDGGREKATGEPLHAALHDAPNEAMTAYEMREALIADLLTHGNAFALIERNGRGQTVALHYRAAQHVRVERLESGRLRYRVTDARGGNQVYRAEEMLHLRYRIGPDGYTGLGPIQLAPEAFLLAIRLDEQARIQAERMNRIEGLLSFPNMLSPGVKDRGLELLQHKVDQNDGTSRLLILDGGADFKPMSFSSRDSEMVETRKLADLAICRAFNVPPTVAGITDNATYSNVEGETKALVTRCLAPMARRIEQAMNAALLPEMARARLYVEHDLAGLLRGDLKARYEAYRIGREWGWLSPNEIRRLENLPEIEGGGEYLSPLNMTEIGGRSDEPA